MLSQRPNCQINNFQRKNSSYQNPYDPQNLDQCFWKSQSECQDQEQFLKYTKIKQKQKRNPEKKSSTFSSFKILTSLRTEQTKNKFHLYLIEKVMKILREKLITCSLALLGQMNLKELGIFVN